MIKLLFLFCLIAFSYVNSFAGTIQLKKLIYIQGNYIRLSNISKPPIEKWQKDIIIAAAPSAGFSVYLSSKTVGKVLERYGIREQIKGRGVFVKSKSFTVNPDYTRIKLLQYINKQNIDITIGKVVGPTIHLKNRNYEVGIRVNDKTFPAAVDLILQTNNYDRTIRYYAFLEHIIKIPISAKSISRGTILTPALIKYREANEYGLKKSVIKHSKNILGRKLTVDMYAMQPFYKNSINQNIVERGDKVSLIYKNKNLLVQQTGIALNNGNTGAMISVRLSSNKIIRGVASKRDVVIFF